MGSRGDGHGGREASGAVRDEKNDAVGGRESVGDLQCDEIVDSIAAELAANESSKARALLQGHRTPERWITVQVVAIDVAAANHVGDIFLAGRIDCTCCRAELSRLIDTDYDAGGTLFFGVTTFNAEFHNILYYVFGEN